MIEYTDEQHDSLIRGHRKQLSDVRATVEALQKKYDDLLGKYRQLVDFYDKHNGTPCEQIRHQQQVEALQRELESANALLHKKNCAIGKAETTIEALQRERDEANLYRDQARANQESLAACVDRDVRKIKDLQAALDAEREKVKGLAQQVQDQSTANLETMRHTDDMQSRALDAERALAQLQALVRALPCLDGEIKVKTYHHESERGQEWDEYECGDAGFDNLEAANVYAALLQYRATLDATTPALTMKEARHIALAILDKAEQERIQASKGGDGE